MFERVLVQLLGGNRRGRGGFFAIEVADDGDSAGDDDDEHEQQEIQVKALKEHFESIRLLDRLIVGGGQVGLAGRGRFRRSPRFGVKTVGSRRVFPGFFWRRA